MITAKEAKALVDSNIQQSAMKYLEEICQEIQNSIDEYYSMECDFVDIPNKYWNIIISELEESLGYQVQRPELDSPTLHKIYWEYIPKETNNQIVEPYDAYDDVGWDGIK